MPEKARIPMVDRTLVKNDAYLTGKEKLNQIPTAVTLALAYINLIMNCISDIADPRRNGPNLTLDDFKPRKEDLEAITGYDVQAGFPKKLCIDQETKDEIVIKPRRGIELRYKAQINVDNPRAGSKGLNEPHVGWSVSRIGKNPNDPICSLACILDKLSDNNSTPRSENVVTLEQMLEKMLPQIFSLLKGNEDSGSHKIVGHACINVNENLLGRKKQIKRYNSFESNICLFVFFLFVDKPLFHHFTRHRLTYNTFSE